MSVNPAQPWLDKASEDLIVARLVLAEQHFAHACFFIRTVHREIVQSVFDRAHKQSSAHA